MFSHEALFILLADGAGAERQAVLEQGVRRLRPGGLELLRAHDADRAGLADVDRVAVVAVGVDLDAESLGILGEVGLGRLTGAEIDRVFALGILGLGVLGQAIDSAREEQGEYRQRNQEASDHRMPHRR